MTSATPLPTAEAVLEALCQRMKTPPPPGLSAAYIDGFFARNREALLLALKARLEQLGAPVKPTAGPTAWGGQRGLVSLAPDQVRAGRRVVVLSSLLEWVHGTVVELPGAARKVRLDSGAIAWFPSLWPEVSPPTSVPRDIAIGSLEGEDYGTLAPFDLWKRIRLLVRHSLRVRQLIMGSGTSEQRKAVALWRIFRDWLTTQKRPRWLSWSGREFRLLELWSTDEANVDGTPERLELDWLLQLPDRYQERFLPGDTVRVIRFGGEGDAVRTEVEMPIERLATSGVIYRRELYPYHTLEPLSSEPGMNTCLPPFEEPVRPLQLFELLKRDGWDWTELSPAQLYAWIDRYLQAHRIEARVQLLGETGGRIRIEPIDSRCDARYLSRDALNQVFLYLPAVKDDAIEIDLFQEEDVFDATLPHLRRAVQVHPALVPSLARALVTMAQEFNLPLNPSILRCLPKPNAPVGEETTSGGRRGAQVMYSPLHMMNGGYRGLRVVTPERMHGRIAWSTQRPGPGPERAEVFRVRLDSGREEDHEQVFLETARPQVIVPDLRIEGRYFAPREVWEKVSLQYFQLIGQTGPARRRARRAVREGHEFLRVWYAAWQAWRRANPETPVAGFDAQADGRIEAFLQEQQGMAGSAGDSGQGFKSSSSG